MASEVMEGVLWCLRLQDRTVILGRRIGLYGRDEVYCVSLGCLARERERERERALIEQK